MYPLRQLHRRVENVKGNGVEKEIATHFSSGSEVSRKRARPIDGFPDEINDEPDVEKSMSCDIREKKSSGAMYD